MPGTMNDKIQSRLQSLSGLEWNPTGFPTEFYTLSDTP